MRTPAGLVLLSLVATALPLAAAPTPGVNASLDRIVPEPYETNDFISYPEARAMLDAIVAAAPQYVEVVEVGESFGWDSLTGSHDTWPVLAVEVTNEASATPREQKRVVVFQLSIHGNEKGGREGGLRVIEDLAVPRLYGQDYRAALDELLVVFTFPNPDGWMHEDPAYRANCAQYLAVDLPTGDCVETQSYVRFNGNRQDLNRDWPTKGWYQTAGGREQAFSEPEMAGLGRYLAPFRGRAYAGADIHGMLQPSDGGLAGSDVVPLIGGAGNGQRAACLPENPAGVECAVREGHFVLGLPVGNAADAEGNLRTVRLYERAKEYLNAMAQEQFPYWSSGPNAGAAGGSWNEWGTGWDTIGYTDSGSTGRWLPEGLGAPGGTFEMSYNHITFDNHYLPELNKMHVESVRAIVRAFLDEAFEPTTPALDTQGRIAFLADARTVARSQGQAEGPHRNGTDDDAYETPYDVSAQRFWRDLARYLPPGKLVPLEPAQLTQAVAHDYRAFVIAGDAWDLVKDDPAAVQRLRDLVGIGHTLFLTDGALRALEALGVAEPGSVEEGQAYLGYVDLDREHELAAGVKGLARQTYDGVSVGYPIPGQGRDASAPVWTVRADALREGDVAGTSLAPERASFGRAPLGQGQVVFLGALLPTPSQEAYHPYSLAPYGVTYTGYQLAYNALGIEEQAVHGQAPAAPPAAPPTRPTPGAEAMVPLVLLAAALLARRATMR